MIIFFSFDYSILGTHTHIHTHIKFVDKWSKQNEIIYATAYWTAAVLYNIRTYEKKNDAERQQKKKSNEIEKTQKKNKFNFKIAKKTWNFFQYHKKVEIIHISRTVNGVQSFVLFLFFI